MRFGSTAKVLAECKLKYYIISECRALSLVQVHAWGQCLPQADSQHGFSHSRHQWQAGQELPYATQAAVRHSNAWDRYWGCIIIIIIIISGTIIMIIIIIIVLIIIIIIIIIVIIIVGTVWLCMPCVRYMSCSCHTFAQGPSCKFQALKQKQTRKIASALSFSHPRCWMSPPDCFRGHRNNRPDHMSKRNLCKMRGYSHAF